MSTTRKRQPPLYEQDGRPGFDITCVIGRVELDEGPHAQPAHVVAFGLIAEHDAPGVYTFPMRNGQTCRVTVDHDGTPTNGGPE